VQESWLIQDRGRTERVPLAEVLYLKAELKYITVRTASRSYILDAALASWKSATPHTSCACTATRWSRATARAGWAVRLNGWKSTRRQLAAVRDAGLNEGWPSCPCNERLGSGALAGAAAIQDPITCWDRGAAVAPNISWRPAGARGVARRPTAMLVV
jgi:hypothetical protein